MLNFAERTGCGAVIFVWSFLLHTRNLMYINTLYIYEEEIASFVLSNRAEETKHRIVEKYFFYNELLFIVQPRLPRMANRSAT